MISNKFTNKYLNDIYFSGDFIDIDEFILTMKSYILDGLFRIFDPDGLSDLKAKKDISFFDFWKYSEFSQTKHGYCLLDLDNFDDLFLKIYAKNGFVKKISFATNSGVELVEFNCFDSISELKNKVGALVVNLLVRYEVR